MVFTSQTRCTPSTDSSAVDRLCLHRSPSVALIRRSMILGTVDWLRLHSHVYQIWLASGTLEEWAKNELEDYDSALNKDARGLLKDLRKHYGAEAYFSIHVEEPDACKTCPRCGSKGSSSPWRKPNRVCRKCRLAFDFSD